MSAAKSFLVVEPTPGKVLKHLLSALREVSSPAAATVFVAQLEDSEFAALGGRIAAEALGIPVLLLRAPGVLTDQGEVERAPAVAGLVIGGCEASLVELAGSSADRLAKSLLELTPRAQSADAVFLFADAAQFEPDLLEVLPLGGRGLPPLIGGGVVESPATLIVGANGSMSSSQAAGLLIGRAGSPASLVTHGTRLLTPLRFITAQKGPWVLEVNGVPALKLFERATQEEVGQSLILAAWCKEQPTPGVLAPEVALYGVQGIDPVSGGILLSNQVPSGFLALAAHDPESARRDLTHKLSELWKGTRGSALRFGLYFDALSRGQNLYSASGVDTRLIKSRFGSMPLAGMVSPFTIGPFSGRPFMHLYSGALTVFTSPS